VVIGLNAELDGEIAMIAQEVIEKVSVLRRQCRDAQAEVDKKISELMREKASISNAYDIELDALFDDDTIEKAYEIALAENEGAESDGEEQIYEHAISVRLMDSWGEQIWVRVPFDKLNAQSV